MKHRMQSMASLTAITKSCSQGAADVPDGQEEVGVRAGRAPNLAGLQVKKMARRPKGSYGLRKQRTRTALVHPICPVTMTCTFTLPLVPVVVQAQPPVSWLERSLPASRPVVPARGRQSGAWRDWTSSLTFQVHSECSSTSEHQADMHGCSAAASTAACQHNPSLPGAGGGEKVPKEGCDAAGSGDGEGTAAAGGGRGENWAAGEVGGGEGRAGTGAGDGEGGGGDSEGDGEAGGGGGEGEGVGGGEGRGEGTGAGGGEGEGGSGEGRGDGDGEGEGDSGAATTVVVAGRLCVGRHRGRVAVLRPAPTNFSRC